MSFEEGFLQSFKTLNIGDIVTGTVIEVKPTEVIVNLMTKSDGVITLDQLTNDPELKATDIVKVGDEIEAFVVRVNDVEGKIHLSRTKIDAIKGREKLVAAS